MRHPFRRYCFCLGEKLGKSINEIMALDAKEISEWMAYELTLNQEWMDRFNEKQELERQKTISVQERADMFKKLLGGSI